VKEHVFYDHLLKPIHEYPVFNSYQTLWWPSILILFCFSLFVYLRVAAPYKLVMTFRSSYNIQAIRQLEREEFNPLNPRSYVLSLLYLLLLSFYLFKVNDTFQYILKEQQPFTQYLFFIATCIVFHFIKFFLKWLIGLISNTGALTSELLYTNMVINQSVGIFLLPSIILLEFSVINTFYMLIGIGLLLLAGFLIKLTRGFIFGVFENQLGLLQVFIYICALELLPFLVFTKFIVTKF